MLLCLISYKPRKLYPLFDTLNDDSGHLEAELQKFSEQLDYFRPENYMQWTIPLKEAASLL